MIRSVVTRSRHIAGVFLAAIGVGLVGLGILCAGCAGVSSQRVAETTTIASVETIDEGVSAFSSWAVLEEHKIAVDAIAACADKKSPGDYSACTAPLVATRRAPIDGVRKALLVYRAALVAGADATDGNLLGAGLSLVNALAQVGIKVTLPLASPPTTTPAPTLAPAAAPPTSSLPERYRDWCRERVEPVIEQFRARTAKVLL